MIRDFVRFAPFLLVATALIFAESESAVAQDNPFGAQVRPTDHLSPADEQKLLQVPDGFSVNLFASEPDIQKPLNMAFDADGRLWVACTVEYPYAAEEGKGRDSIRILEDTDGDDRSDKVTVFADNLNIPIGLYPYKDGVIAFSIPNIWFFRDTDGDGKADKQEKLYGPFDFSRDTHGLNNAFRRGYDGWIYACHGHANRSVVSGRDGHEIIMDHGNTYRFRPDGERIEYFDRGQTNPFGMTIDEFGDVFTSDCHSMPVSLLIRDGYHPGFGRPHDGLGFVPSVMKHQHGSTAIDAVCQYQGTAFPDDFHNDLLVGNVMTSRVHRDKIVRTGSSIRVEEMDDFVVSKDPWFRPVDIQYGPDDALYVADFYNRIIGHYEVPLDHPGRDRDSGRIWRITADNGQPATPDVPQLASADVDQLIAALEHSDKPVRQHALDQLTDRIGQAAVPVLNAALPAAGERSAPEILWGLSRLNALTGIQLLAAAESRHRRVRIHAMRIASETAFDASISKTILKGLQDRDAQVRRAAADAASRHPAPEIAQQVLAALDTVDKGDVHLRHNLRIALRNQLRSESVIPAVAVSGLSKSAATKIGDVLPGLTGSTVTPLSLALVNSGAIGPGRSRAAVKQAAGEATESQLTSLVDATIALSDKAGDLDQSVALWNGLTDGFDRGVVRTPATFRSWEERLSRQILSQTDIDKSQWGLYLFDRPPAAPWAFENRKFDPDAPKPLRIINSQPGREGRTSLLRSATFEMPVRLAFNVFGSYGFPDAPDRRNRVRLVELESGRVVADTASAGSEFGRSVEWEFPKLLGKSVCIEVISAIDSPFYSWIGIGQIDPPVLSIDAFDTGATSDRVAAVVRVLSNKVRNGTPLSAEELATVTTFLETRHLDGTTRSAAAEFLLATSSRRHLAPLAELLLMGTLPLTAEAAIIQLCRGHESDDESSVVKSVFATLDAGLRNRLAAGCAGRAETAMLLLELMDDGVPSPDLLRDERLFQQFVAHGEKHQELAERLVSELPPQAEISPQVMQSILNEVKDGSPDIAAGRAVFDKHCKVCHKRAGQGGEAGPQLDGLASRGAKRSLEDILQPNANVDISFRTSVIILNDGRVLTGIVKDIGNGELLVVDVEGKSQRIKAADIDERRDMRLSLMPSNFGTSIRKNELADLVAWLMTESTPQTERIEIPK